MIRISKYTKLVMKQYMTLLDTPFNYKLRGKAKRKITLTFQSYWEFEQKNNKNYENIY